MRIIRNYFLKEFFHHFIFSLLCITFVMVLGNLIKLSDMVVRKGVNPITAFKLFIFYIPYLLEFSLPLSCLMGILLANGRISSDNEIVALKVSGISMLRILSIFIVLGLVGSLFLLYLNDRVVPRSHFLSRQALKEMSQDNPLGFVEPGVFIDEFKDFVLFTHDVEGNILKKVFIYEIKQDTSNLIYAERGEFVVDNDILRIKLKTGFIEGPDMKYRIHFKNHFMHLPIEKDAAEISKKPKDMGIKELSRAIAEFKQKKIDPLPFQVELNKKISLSFSTIVFIILGFGVAGRMKHREKSINFGVCFLLTLGYYLLSILGETLTLKGILPVAAGIWLSNIIFLAIGVFFLYKTCAS